MATVLAGNWGALAVRGCAAIVFGLAALFLPGVTLAALVLMFGAYALIDGFLTIFTAFRGPAAGRPWWSLAVEGLVSIAAGVAALVIPGAAAIALVYVVGAWALLTGALRIAAAIRLRRVITGEWRLMLGGIASLVFGALLMLAPAVGALAIVLWIGAYALVAGAALLALSFRVRSLNADVAGRERRFRRAA
jgi:uncharacterized membrane protein HdeD (DUF308 family)